MNHCMNQIIIMGYLLIKAITHFEVLRSKSENLEIQIAADSFHYQSKDF